MLDVAPTLVDANESAELDSDAAGVPTTTATPVPERDTVLVAGDALWVIVIAPVLAPAAVGVKEAVTEQLLPAAMLAPAVQVLAVIVKSPLIAVEVIANAAVPELVSVVV